MEALFVVLGLLAFSALLGLTGSYWAALLPGAVFVVGVSLAIGAEPNSGGGDMDPQGPVGFLIAIVGVGSAFVVLVVCAVVRNWRQERERRDHETRVEI